MGRARGGGGQELIADNVEGEKRWGPWGFPPPASTHEVLPGQSLSWVRSRVVQHRVIHVFNVKGGTTIFVLPLSYLYPIVPLNSHRG